MKKHLTSYLTAALMLVVLVSCNRNNLAMRYKNRSENLYIWLQKEEVANYVTVDVERNDQQEVTTKTEAGNIFDLTSGGQGELIKALNGKEHTTDLLLSKLGTRLSSQEVTTKVKIIPRTIKKYLNFKIDRVSLPAILYQKYQKDQEKSNRDEAKGVAVARFNGQGDRIVLLEFEYDLTSTDVRFNNWNQLETSYASINLGKATGTQQFGANVSLSAKGNTTISSVNGNTDETLENITGSTSSTDKQVSTGRELTGLYSGSSQNQKKDGSNKATTTGVSAELGGSANANYSDTYQTSMDLTNRIIRFSGFLRDKTITVRQEGAYGQDLSGNQNILVEYATSADWAPPITVQKFRSFFSANLPIASRDLEKQMDEMIIIYPDVKTDVRAKLKYKFLYRRIDAGGRHLPEAKHKVKLLYGQTGYLDTDNPAQELTAVKKTDFRPKTYTLVSQVGENRLSLLFKDKAIQFETMQEASLLYAYLNQLFRVRGDATQFKLIGTPLSLPSSARALTGSDIASLRLVALAN